MTDVKYCGASIIFFLISRRPKLNDEASQTDSDAERGEGRSAGADGAEQIALRTMGQEAETEALNRADPLPMDELDVNREGEERAPAQGAPRQAQDPAPPMPPGPPTPQEPQMPQGPVMAPGPVVPPGPPIGYGIAATPGPAIQAGGPNQQAHPFAPNGYVLLPQDEPNLVEQAMPSSNLARDPSRVGDMAAPHKADKS